MISCPFRFRTTRLHDLFTSSPFSCASHFQSQFGVAPSLMFSQATTTTTTQLLSKIRNVFNYYSIRLAMNVELSKLDLSNTASALTKACQELLWWPYILLIILQHPQTLAAMFVLVLIIKICSVFVCLD